MGSLIDNPGSQVTCLQATSRLVELLRESPHGVITLIGPQGSGKSVAIAGLIREAPARLPGVSVFHVDCDTKRTVDDMVDLLLEEMGIVPVPDSATFTRLALHRGIGEKGPLLVVLDNAHQLDGDARARMLTLASLHGNLALVMAATRPAGHHLERVIRLQPLDTAVDAQGVTGTAGQAESISPAGRFVIDTAQRVHPALRIGSAMATVLDGCARLVGGNPRCLNRIATLLDRKSASALYDELRKGLHAALAEAYAPAAPGMAERYLALDKSEQRLLLLCAQLDGIFTPEILESSAESTEHLHALFGRLFVEGLAESIPDATTGTPRAILHPMWRDLCRRTPPESQSVAAVVELATYFSQLVPLTPAVSAEQILILRRETSSISSLLQSGVELPLAVEVRLRGQVVLARIGLPDNDSALADLRALLLAHDQQLDTDTRLSAHQVCALGFLRASHFAAAREHLPSLCELSEHATAGARVTGAVVGALVAWTDGGWRAALELIERISADDLEGSLSTSCADYQLLRGYLHLLNGDSDAALELTDLVKLNGTPLTMTYCGLSYLALGRAEQALEGLQHYVGIAQRLGDWYAVGLGTTRLGIANFCLGRFFAAKAAFLRGVELSVELRSEVLGCSSHCWLAAFRLGMNEGPFAMEDAQWAFDAATGGIETLAALAGSTLAIAELNAGRDEVAAELVHTSRGYLAVSGVVGMDDLLDAILAVATCQRGTEEMAAAHRSLAIVVQQRSLRIRTLVVGLSHELARRDPQHGDLRVLRDGSAFQIVGDDAVVELRSRKAVANLLSKLIPAVAWREGGWVPALELAELVWPEPSEPAAKLNRLRVTINALRAAGARAAIESSEQGYTITRGMRVVVFDGELPPVAGAT